MTVQERMKASQERLNNSVQRLERAICAMSDAQNDLMDATWRFKANMNGLGKIIDSIGHNLTRYEKELTRLRGGVTELGGKSRRLSAIMDDYLTGRTASQRNRAA